MSLSADAARLLIRELETMEREIDLFPDDDTVWQTVPGVSNSAGNLALHLAGNLQHYIGAVMGSSGYVRNRPVEFNARLRPKSEVIAELRNANDVVRRVLPTISDAQLAQPFPEAVGSVTPRTGFFLLHLCAHAAFHVGQAGYLRRVLTGDARTSGAVDVKALA
jgi:uncharacterized damage-inducible protein DinB